MTLPRLLADECCPLPLVAALRDQGFDLRYVAEEAPGLSDEAVLAPAEQERRIVITTDKDFGTLVMRLEDPVAGLILLRVARLGTEAIAELVAKRICETAEGLIGHVTTFAETVTRRRALP